MIDEPGPSVVDILNRFPELVGLTPTQVRLWRRLWLEQGQPVARDTLIAAVWGIEANTAADRHSFDAALSQLRRKLRNHGWEVASHPAPTRGTDIRYSLHPSVSDDPLEKEIEP
jgi:hypothetical protein